MARKECGTDAAGVLPETPRSDAGSAAERQSVRQRHTEGIQQVPAGRCHTASDDHALRSEQGHGRGQPRRERVDRLGPQRPGLNIPDTIYEAASVDGATAWKKFTAITLPLLAPATFFVLVITLIEAFKTFEVTYVMTGGGPQNASNTLAFFIYENAFVFSRMGYASALAMVLLAVVALVTILLFRIQKTRVSSMR